MVRRLLLALAALVASFATACSPVAATPELKPALWRLRDADTTIYLFGTIHLLPARLKWQSPKIAAAIKGADGLVLETVLDPDPAKTAAILTKLGMTPGLPPLIDRVPPDKRAALAEAVKKAGVPMAVLDKFETWAATLTLASASLAELPAARDDGAEQILTRAFRAAGKPVAGLETPAEQLGYFDALSEDAQQRFLIGTIEDTSDAKAEFAAMLAAWGRGDLKRIALSFDDELKLSPELADALLRNRNARWAQWIAARMDKPGTVLVAVGAGHLAGPQSVEAMLGARGLKVERLQ